MYILYTFYFSYLRFKQVSHCSRQVFISFNCLRFEWDNIHKILNPVPGIQQEHTIVTILFIKYWEWRTDVEGILSSWCWRCFAHVSFWIMVFSVICSVVFISPSRLLTIISTQPHSAPLKETNISLKIIALVGSPQWNSALWSQRNDWEIFTHYCLRIHQKFFKNETVSSLFCYLSKLWEM